MSAKEAAAAWTQNYLGAGVSENVAGLNIIADFGAFIEKHPSAGEIRDVKFLPHDKKDILDAIYQNIQTEPNREKVEWLKIGALLLADFQHDIGDQPLSALGVNINPPDLSSLSKDQLRALAAKIANNPDRERFESFNRIANQERDNIQAQLRTLNLVRPLAE